MLPQFIDLIIIFFPVYSPDMLKRLPMKDIFIELIIIFSVYSPDMPKRLPVKDIFGGLLSSIGRAVRYWFHYTLVAFAWLGIVPLTACTYFTWNNQILFKNWILISINIMLTIIIYFYVGSSEIDCLCYLFFQVVFIDVCSRAPSVHYLPYR